MVGDAAFLPGYNGDIAVPELWMLDLFVVPTARGRGIGGALIRAVARETLRRGLTCLDDARLGGQDIVSLVGRSLRTLAASAEWRPPP